MTSPVELALADCVHMLLEDRARRIANDHADADMAAKLLAAEDRCRRLEVQLAASLADFDALVKWREADDAAKGMAI